MPRSKTRRRRIKTRKGGAAYIPSQPQPQPQQQFRIPRSAMQMHRNIAKINRIDYGTRNYRTTVKNLDKNLTRFIKGQKSLQKVGKPNFLDMSLKNQSQDTNFLSKRINKLAMDKSPKAFKFDLRKTIKGINKYIGRERKNDRKIILTPEDNQRSSQNRLPNEDEGIVKGPA